MIRKPLRGPLIAYNSQRNYYSAVDAFILSQHRERLDADSRASLEHHHIPSGAKTVDVELPKFSNTLSADKGATGGFSVPEGFIGGWIRAQSALNVVRALATVHSVDHGGTFMLPATQDALLEGEMLGELQAGTTSDIVFARNALALRRFCSHPVKVPFELQADSPRFAEQLGACLGAQVARIQNRKYTLGTGGGTDPLGLIYGATTLAAGSATAISSDDVAGLIGAVGGEYVDTESSAFMCSQTVLVLLLKLKDAQGRPLFSYSSGRLLGFRLRLNNHLSTTVTSGDRTILFGDFKAFHVVEMPLSLQVAYETSADVDQVTYRATQRANGIIANTGDSPVAVLVH